MGAVPELPDLTVYVDALQHRLVGSRLQRVRLQSPFLLRSVDPPLSAVETLRAEAVGLLGKRIVISFERDLHLALHLMIAGRLRWLDPGAALPRRIGLAGFGFPGGTLALTEAGS